jgi:hypothetical protein
MRSVSSVFVAVVGVLGLQAAHAGAAVAVVERVVTEETIARKANVDSRGDLLVFQNPIYDSQNAKQIGNDNGYCVRTVPGKSYECTWTLSLSDGTIVAAGTYNDGVDSVLAITGGTGKYSGARGHLKLHARDAKASAYDFVYELL